MRALLQFHVRRRAAIQTLAPYTNGEVGPVLRHRRGKTPNYLKAGHAMTEDTILGPTIAYNLAQG